MRYIFIILIALSLQSCVTYQACKDKYGMTQDTVYVYKDTTIYVHDSVFVKSDSMQGVVAVGESESISKDLSVVFSEDSGKIKYKAKYKPHYVYINKSFKITERYKTTTTIWKTPVEKPWWKFRVPHFTFRELCLIFLAILLFFTCGYFINAIKRRT
jgi:hypothetical protein